MSGVLWPVSGGRWSSGRCPVAGGPVAGGRSGVRWPVAVAGAAELQLGDRSTSTTTTTTKTTTTSSATNIVAWARVPVSSNMNKLTF